MSRGLRGKARPGEGDGLGHGKIYVTPKEMCLVFGSVTSMWERC